MTYILKQCNVTFLNFNILTITVTQLLPKMKNGQNWSKIGPEAKMPFSPFLGIIFGVFVETSLKTVHTFLMGHILKFPAKSFFCRAAPKGVQKKTAQSRSKLHFCQDLHLYICWDIFHKLPLNNILLAIRVPLKHFFLKLLWLGRVMGPKMAQNALFPYFLELFLVLLLRHSSKHYRVSQWVMD